LAAAGFDVVGEAADGRRAVALSLELQPDVVMMDLDMPGMGGIEATRRIAHGSPHVGILVLTMLADDDSVFAALRVGARGYLLKEAGQAEIVRAVQTVADGGAVFGASLARRVMDYFSAQQATEPFPELTDREREVLALVGAGHKQRRDRRPARTRTQDSAEPHFQHHDKAPCLRPGPGHHPRAYGRVGIADPPVSQCGPDAARFAGTSAPRWRAGQSPRWRCQQACTRGR
jgi:CheY-like chemotaxis protein